MIKQETLRECLVVAVLVAVFVIFSSPPNYKRGQAVSRVYSGQITTEPLFPQGSTDFTGGTMVTTKAVVPASTPIAEVNYTVARGDTLWAIATKHCMDYRVIARENGIANPNRIYPGQVVRISGSCQTSQVAVQSSLPHTPIAHEPAPLSRDILPSSDETQWTGSPMVSSMPDQRPLEEILRVKIDRIISIQQALRKQYSVALSDELVRLQQEVRKAVLERYPLFAGVCLYKSVDKTRDNDVIARVRCIRSNYRFELMDAGEQYGIDQSYLEAIIFLQSGGQADVITPSACGIQGFSDQIRRKIGLKDCFNPFASIHAGAQQLADQLRQSNGDMAKAIALQHHVGMETTPSTFKREVLRIQRLIRRSDEAKQE